MMMMMMMMMPVSKRGCLSIVVKSCGGQPTVGGSSSWSLGGRLTVSYHKNCSMLDVKYCCILRRIIRRCSHSQEGNITTILKDRPGSTVTKLRVPENLENLMNTVAAVVFVRRSLACNELRTAVYSCRTEAVYILH